MKVTEAPTPEKVGALCEAVVYYMVDHLPRRGITSQEIVDRFGLGSTWYVYPGSHRRVNMSGQLVRNALNRYFKENRLVKLYSPRTGDYVKRNNCIVYFKPNILKEQVAYGDRLPDKRKWVK